MSQIRTTPPKTRKPMAWGDAGLIGAGFSIAIIAICSYFAIFNEHTRASFEQLNTFTLLSFFVLPSIVASAVFAFRYHSKPNLILETIKVSMLSITVPAGTFILVFSTLIYARYSSYLWRIFVFAAVFLVATYFFMAIVSFVLCYFSKRYHKQQHTDLTKTQ